MTGEPPPSCGPVGVYLHFPFCAIRCTYCDFATVAGRDELIEAYIAALCRELREFQPGLPAAADTVFLGGGTPSRLSGEQVAHVLEVVRERFELQQGAEITIECNPESLDETKLCAYLAAGITRVSIGVQSLDDSALRGVGRAHDARTAIEAVRTACAQSGLEVSVDMIAGLPGERLSDWPRAMARIAGLGTDHASVYLLETDKDTPLARSIRSGRTPALDDSALVDAYEDTLQVFGREGLQLYEISNFARARRRSRHNVKYWSDVWYGGFGLGAHAYSRGGRRSNRRDLDGYLADLSAGRDPIDNEDPWNPGRRLDEAVILGLRMVDGLDVTTLERRYETDLRSRYATAWDRGEEDGLLHWRPGADGVRALLTSRGRLLSNSLFSEIIDT